jgi:hypothetical protein
VSLLVSDHLFPLKGRYILLDNDFFDGIFKHQDLFRGVLPLLTDNLTLIDPLVAFEFLQTVYIPQEREVREKFLATDFFHPAVNTPEAFLKIQENGLFLSQLYEQSSSNRGNKRNQGPSSIDLLLAGRILYMRNNVPLLITGNKKHFPSSIFDTIGTLVWENEENGDAITYFVLEFSKEKFRNCYQHFKKCQ